LQNITTIKRAHVYSRVGTQMKLAALKMKKST
jgi:hypothetical protein